MKFEECKFMAIGGNCASIPLLGGNIRIRGPVDNVVIEKVDAIKMLFENKYLDAIKTYNCIQIETPHPKDHEPKYSSQFSFGVTIVHNDPKTEHYYETLAERIVNFNIFYKEINLPNHYFIFTLNQRTNFYGLKKLRGTLLIDIIKYLNKLNILDKVIFIGTAEAATIKEPWTYFNYALNDKDLTMLKKKYNIKYIELTNVNMLDIEGKLAAHEQFKQKLLKL